MLLDLPAFVEPALLYSAGAVGLGFYARRAANQWCAMMAICAAALAVLLWSFALTSWGFLIALLVLAMTRSGWPMTESLLASGASWLAGKPKA